MVHSLTLIAHTLAIVSSVLWVLLPFAILRRVVYPDPDAPVVRRDSVEGMTPEELATLHAIATQTAQLRQNRFLAEVEPREGARTAAEWRQEKIGVTAVAQEIDQSSNQSSSITKCCVHVLKRLNACRASNLDIDEVTRGKLVLLVALIQLCWIPVGFYFYWERQPIASDLEIYMFNLPAVLLVVGSLLILGLLGFGLGSFVLFVAINICFGVPMWIVLRLLYICYQRQEAARIEKDVWEWFDKKTKSTLFLFTWLDGRYT